MADTQVRHPPTPEDDDFYPSEEEEDVMDDSAASGGKPKNGTLLLLIGIVCGVVGCKFLTGGRLTAASVQQAAQALAVAAEMLMKLDIVQTIELVARLLLLSIGAAVAWQVVKRFPQFFRWSGEILDAGVKAVCTMGQNMGNTLREGLGIFDVRRSDANDELGAAEHLAQELERQKKELDDALR